ncbi:MAG: hypothetical protein NUV57_03935 [archaeon]|nr:hypothetical protein [archaeon]
MEKKYVIAGIILALAFAVLFQGELTGFVSLDNHPKEKLEINVFDNNSEEQAMISSKIVSAKLSFEVVEPAELKAELIEGKLFPCPNYSNLVFEVENISAGTAERIMVNYPSNLIVENCINCSLKKVVSGAKETVKIKACRAVSDEIQVEFSSVNAGNLSVKID